MPTATERIPVLMTPAEKQRVVLKAKNAGMKTGQFMRLAAESYQPGKDEDALAAMIDRMNASTANACHAIDKALTAIAQSNQRIEKLEAARR